MKKFLKSKLIFVFVVVAMLSAVAGVLGVPSSARASTTIQIQGAVSCASHAVKGVWVEYGNNGQFANINESPGDSWDGVYWTKIMVTLPTILSLHVGCDWVNGHWGSDNWAPWVTIGQQDVTNGYVTLTAKCDENTPTSTVQRCTYDQTQAESTAISWARPYVGTNKYYNQCLTFVFDMYKFENINLRQWVNYPIDGNTYPADVWPKITNGLKGTDQSPPAGALIFYIPKYGVSHVTLSIGGGWAISTADSVDGSHIHYETLAQHASSGAYNSYVGWWLPA